MTTGARALTILVALFGVLAPSAMSHAQGRARERAPMTQVVAIERVRMALERTDRRIELARTLPAASNDRSRQEVAAASGLQAQARSRLDQAAAAAGPARRELLGQAFDLTLQARGRVDRVLSTAQGLPDPERVSTQVERTRDVVERAHERIGGCDRDRARALIEIALGMQERAEAALGDSRYLAALQLTLSAREHAQRALRLCNLEEDPQAAAERALQRTDLVLARARQVVGDRGSPKTKELLTRAERAQEEARARSRGGQFAASLEMTQSARSQANRAIRLAGGAP